MQLLAYLARAQLGLGDAATARVTAEEAIAVARRQGTRPYEIEAHIVLGRALIHADARRGEVEATLDAELSLVEDTGARGYLPFIHLERAALARLLGDVTRRQRELAEAHRLLTEMAAPIRAEQVARELAAARAGDDPSAAGRFCNGCGAPIAAGPSAGQPDPRDYTPKHLAEKIRTTRAALEGERKHVTVLFADLKGSMELAEQVDPVDWHRLRRASCGRALQLPRRSSAGGPRPGSARAGVPDRPRTPHETAWRGTSRGLPALVATARRRRAAMPAPASPASRFASRPAGADE